MSSASPQETSAMIGIYYTPEADIATISEGEREFCLALLENMEFQCEGGAVGTGPDQQFNVGRLASDALNESVTLVRIQKAGNFVVGPHPYIETGIGIWTAGQSPLHET